MSVDQLVALAIANRWEVLAVITGIISVYLSTRENIWSWPTALVNVALYFVVFYEAKLYADMGLQVVYFVLSVYGWYEWLYGGANRTELHVSRTPRPKTKRMRRKSTIATAASETTTPHQRPAGPSDVLKPRSALTGTPMIQ